MSALRLSQYFKLVHAYRKSTDSLQRKVIVDDALPALAEGTASPKIRLAIDKFIKENTNAKQAG